MLPDLGRYRNRCGVGGSGSPPGLRRRSDPGCRIGDGSLGTVEVEAGAAIQIRSVNNISGDVARLGVTKQRGVELALADYGPVHGFAVSIGIGISDGCSADGGRRAAESVASDPEVIGVIGTSCSSAATTAAPILAGAGMVMISPSNTSPALTSDLAGIVGEHHHPGYYRTSHNDLYQGQAVARFIRSRGRCADDRPGGGENRPERDRPVPRADRDHILRRVRRLRYPEDHRDPPHRRQRH
ncbi:MAG: ABC transporter substrate-binding protein [Acidimicrobiia bacterium]|nr:ABC transporter substrate-binding protein [Acidimicrobiia bacterium]